MCEENSQYSKYIERLFEKTGNRKRRMPFEWIEPIIEEASKIGIREIIPTTMGDPLVTLHFEKIIAAVKKYGLKLNVTHNGTFPGKSVQEWANLIIPVTSDIKISWNGSKSETAESIMKGISFEKAKMNLEDFITERNQIYGDSGHYCSISLQLTYMTLNFEEIPEIIEFAISAGVDRIKGHHLWTHFEEIENLSLKNNKTSISKWNQFIDNLPEIKKRLEAKYGRNVKLENFVRIQDIEMTVIPEEYECPFLGKELWISAVGKYSPCCAPDEQRDSLGDFGYYPNKKISDVIKSYEYQELVKTYKSKELCKQCKMRRPI